jgi:hypothetical protein
MGRFQVSVIRIEPYFDNIVDGDLFENPSIHVGVTSM